MYNYNCPDCEEAKLQSDKNTRKINEVIDQVNELTSLYKDTENFIQQKAEEKVEQVANVKLPGMVNNILDEVNNAVNLEGFKLIEGETTDFPRLNRALQYCRDNGYRAIRISKDINIGDNTIIIDIKYFSLIGTINNDKRVTIKGSSNKIISVQEQGFSIESLSIEGNLDENNSWLCANSVGISYDYGKQDSDSKITNCRFIRCDKAIYFKGRNLDVKNCILIFCNIGISLNQNKDDMENVWGADLRGIKIENLVCHTIGQNLKNHGDCIIEVNDCTNNQDILINNIIIEQGCKQFFRGYINGCNIENVNVSNCYGKGKFIEIYERPSTVTLKDSCINGNFIFNSTGLLDLSLNDCVDNLIFAEKLEKCTINVKVSGTKESAIYLGNVDQCIIDGNIIYRVGYRTDLTSSNTYSGIKITGTLSNSTIFDNYINSKTMKYGIEIEGTVAGSFIDRNKVFYANTDSIYYKSNDASDFETITNGRSITTRRNSSNINANATVGEYMVRGYNDNALYDVGSFRFVYNNGVGGSENTNIQCYVKKNGSFVRVCAFNSQGISVEKDKFLMLQGKFLWFDSSNRLRCATGQPTNLDSEGTIIGTQS